MQQLKTTATQITDSVQTCCRSLHGNNDNSSTVETGCCKHCKQPTSAPRQVCQRCLLSQHGSPFDALYYRAEKTRLEQEARREQKRLEVANG